MNDIRDKEIIKALECCVPSYNKSCDKCKYQNQKTKFISLHTCSENLRKDVLDLINRQQAELKSLRALKAYLDNLCGLDLEILGVDQQGDLISYDDYYKDILNEIGLGG